jgi:hypothetical protein
MSASPPVRDDKPKSEAAFRISKWRAWDSGPRGLSPALLVSRGGIVKEHGQTRGRDAQEIRPSTPASTALEVRSLAIPGTTIEVEAVAVL